ncbi:metallophosphoesterase family protein [Bordetella avium]|uniref:Metallo-phosphoesterase n=1 Tax=Bordetella avium (strain 197N) TaxID=360910 RepID=Q2KV33_BORA1|nr:metallophosphoesterase [Bordetella avium]AZY51917.1 metallophosphoesterase [Bordetella avium]RIQ13844.1 metallophosphoesterase [Bordetella avium]RIQ17082.1 metallophosphoesterase [Bordetella avium]RIQ36192.1 metallophosphoesterase [Bordetella avium]RIQ39541.1 metallophosphoesterase [Bordetella avium]
MTRVLHISDTHFGRQVVPVVQALEVLIQRLDPDLVLLSGDITQRARRGQFAAARQFVQGLRRPVLTVPGNHDMPLFNLAARLFNPYGNYRRAMGVNLEPVFDGEHLLVVGVNSSRPSRRKHGEVSPEQIERVASRLRAARPGQLRIVMLHHPVRGPKAGDSANLLIRRELAVPAWVDAGADFIAAGHAHLPYMLPLGGSRCAWCLQAGTAVSSRLRGGMPNSVNLIEHGGHDVCLVQRWDFNAASGFQETVVQTLTLSRP